MRNIEWRGIITAQSSLAHGGKDSGTNHGFRRETIILPTGRRIPAPIISGSVIRGSIRRLAASMAISAITEPGERLPFAAVHAFRTGGALRETRSKDEVITGEKQALMRDLLPMLSIFGFSGRGRIASGRLIVDKGLPLTQETHYLAPVYGVDVDPDTLPSVWEIVQREQYTRFGEVGDSVQSGLVDIEQGIPEMAKGGGNMLWSQETLAAGTRLFHSIRVEEVTAVEASFMNELVQRWMAGAHIGAQRARGMGRVSFDYERVCTNVLGDVAEDEPAQEWRDHAIEHRAAIHEAISWL